VAEPFGVGGKRRVGLVVCRALGRSLASPTHTTDRQWLTWADDLDVRVVVIR